MRGKEYEDWTLKQARIQDCRHLLITVNGAKSISEINRGLRNLQSNDYTRMWGLRDNDRKRRRNLDKAYIRIILEVPEERIEDISNKIWSWSSDCPFKKVDILCRWCQFAEGNEIPQAMNDGKPKDLLTGSIVRRRPWSGYMTNAPVCLCNR
jgi:hypothetical protein